MGPIACALVESIEGVILEKRSAGSVTLRISCETARAPAMGKRPARVNHAPMPAGMASLSRGLTESQMRALTEGIEELVRSSVSGDRTPYGRAVSYVTACDRLHGPQQPSLDLDLLPRGGSPPRLNGRTHLMAASRCARHGV